MRHLTRSTVTVAVGVLIGVVILVFVTNGSGLAPAAILVSTLAIATPLLLAAMGGLISERAGVVNIGLEGMMIVGALAGFLISNATGSWVAGVAGGAIAAGLLALVHAFVSIVLNADQVISGTAVNLLGLFGTEYVFRTFFGLGSELPAIQRAPTLAFPGLGSLNIITIVAVVAVPVLAFVMFRTPVGLRLRSVGENPLAAQTVAIHVVKLRFAAVILSGVLAGIGGAYLSVGSLGSFSEGMTNGRGFIALAAVIVGRWNPFGALAACLLFAVVSALGNGFQVSAGISADLTAGMPYLLTLIAIVVFRESASAPASLGKPLR
ncbi:ABC transporter permease [Naasia lichenicola]|uniref:ABC transporter permease n=1 Tax=Naasia lichenicola TaxID=2565933 RepID=A0A4S4FIB8_9MICO|nr:ABC transporter permease [Naasia lichenicola]THG30083.1 ABC transporter permease [Naasia lichenicola]